MIYCVDVDIIQEIQGKFQSFSYKKFCLSHFPCLIMNCCLLLFQERSVLRMKAQQLPSLLFRWMTIWVASQCRVENFKAMNLLTLLAISKEVWNTRYYIWTISIMTPFLFLSMSSEKESSLRTGFFVLFLYQSVLFTDDIFQNLLDT